MLTHAKTQHNENIERVPNATIGRDSITLKIFGMQGVPRVEIEAWISKNINRYWGRIIEKKNAEIKKEMTEQAKIAKDEFKKGEMEVEHNH